jgi:hypothetical protein
LAGDPTAAAPNRRHDAMTRHFQGKGEQEIEPFRTHG